MHIEKSVGGWWCELTLWIDIAELPSFKMNKKLLKLLHSSY